MLAVGGMTEAVLSDAQQVQAHALNDLADSLTGVAVQLGVNVVEGVEQEGQGHNVQALVKCGVDQVGVSGQLGGAVHNSLDALGLVTGSQLVGSVDLNLNGTAGSVADHLAEVTAHVSPAGVLGSGAGITPGLLLESGAGFGVAGVGAAVSGVGIAAAGAAAAAGCQGQSHGQSQSKCKKLFHGFSSSKCLKISELP